MKNMERMLLAEWSVDQVLKNGADETSIDITNSREIEIQYRDRKLENLKESTSNSLTLAVYANHRFSMHSTSDMRKDALKKFIEEAVSATKYLSEDEYRSLPKPKHYPSAFDIDLEICDEGYENIDSELRKKIAAETEQAALAQSDKIISAECGYSDGYYESVKVHSNGLKAEQKSTVFSAGASVTVRDSGGGRPEDWSWGTVRYFKDLPKPEIFGEDAVRRALRKIGQTKIESGKYDIVVENRSGGRLLSMLSRPMTARALQQKSSFLENMLDKKIASEILTVTDDPFIKKGLGSRLYDNEGIATRKKVIIEKGVLRNFYIDNYYGKKIGQEPNCGSPNNLIFEYGDKSAGDIIKGIKKGLFITGFIGGNSNPTTGDFSFGLVGMLIEDGELVKPVNELNISGNAKEFWNTLTEIGNDPYEYSSYKIPTMHFASADISGK